MRASALRGYEKAYNGPGAQLLLSNTSTMFLQNTHHPWEQSGIYA